MKPHRPKETRKSRTLAQARMHLKGTLGWVEGYPAERTKAGGLRWVVPHEGGAPYREVDRIVVARTVRACKELVSDFPEALPDLVGDVRGFVAGVERVTKWAAVALRDGVPEGSLFGLEPAYGRDVGAKVRGLLARHPELRPTLVALSFRGLMSPKTALASLAHIADHGEGYARASQALAARAASPGGGPPAERVWLELDVLRRNNPATTRGLEQVLLDPRTHGTALHGGAEATRALLAAVRRVAKGKPGKLPHVVQPAASTLGHALTVWLPELIATEPATQKRALALFDLLEPQETVVRWHTFWETLTLLGDRAHALERSVVATGRKDKTPPAGMRERERKIAALLEGAPPDVALASQLAGILALSHPDERAHYTNYLACLTAIPVRLEAHDLRAELLVDWSSDRHDEDRAHLLQGFVSGLRGMLTGSSAEVSALLHPFASAPRRRMYSNLTRVIARELETPASRARFFRAWERCAAGGEPPFRNTHAELLARTAPHAPDADTAVAWMKTLAETDAYVSTEVIAFVATLAKGTPASFGELLACVQKLDFENRNARRLARWLEAPERVGLVRDALLDGHGPLLKTAIVRMEALAEADGPLPAPLPVPDHAAPAVAAHLRGYPPALRPALGRLIPWVADREGTPLRLLGPAFRTRDDLERELAVIRAKRRESDTSPLARRQAALERRLEGGDSTRPASPEKLARLAAKVELAARRAYLDAWVVALDRALDEKLEATLGLRDHPPALRAPRVRECLLAVLGLGPQTRALARMVLSRHFDGGPRDFRDHPANAAFLAALVRRGVDPGPWLEGTGAVVENVPAMGTVTLALEDDPLEILEMGRHFGTCLSPFAYNYFSVFANIVDINKRVLYARDGQHKVVGRCLLALTAAGGILTFHAYRHGAMDFEAMVKRFASELAARMGVTVLARGKVPLLVAHDWYDDGPVDRSGRLPFLEDGSAFRAALATVPLDEVRGLCERAMAPLGLNELTVPSLLDLPEVKARPELAVAFAPMIGELHAVPEHVILRLAELLHAAGRGELLEEGAVFAAATRVERSASRLSGPLLRNLARLFPSSTLRLLRDTRERGVRSDVEEWNPDRLLAAAEAMHALFRKQRALELYRRAIKARLPSEARAYCRAQIAMLKKGQRNRHAS